MRILNKKGFVNLILGMFIFFFNTMLVLVLMNTFFSLTEVTQSMVDPLTSYYRADAGIQRAKYLLDQSGWITGHRPYTEQFDIDGVAGWDVQIDIVINIAKPNDYAITSSTNPANGAVRRITANYVGGGVGDLNFRS